jgi:hypothetical protein
MDFKQNVTDAELSQALKELGINEDDAKKTDCTPQQAVAVGDTFTLTGVRKVRDTINNGFLPLVFTTSNGKSIGTKNFADVEYPRDSTGIQPIGRTIEDALSFLVWAKNNRVEFNVDRIKYGEPRKIRNADGTDIEYTPKRVELSVIEKKSK